MPLAIGYRGIKMPKQKPHRSPFDGSWHSILASAYGVSREELEQREKIRQRQRRNTIAAITGTVMLALAALTVYSFWERSIAIEQRNRALRGQSLYLAQLASEQIRGGNTSAAIQLALEALPKNMSAPERPYVSEAELQLGDALLNHRELHVLTGHQDRVTFAQFSPDSQSVLSASHDHTARLWDARTGTLKATLTGHGDRVTHGAFSPDGNTIVTTSADGGVGVWKTADGSRIRMMRDHKDAAWHVSFTADGTRFVTSSRDNTARVWSTNGTEPAVTLTTPNLQWPLGNAEIAPDGRFVAVGNRGVGADIFDSRTGTLLAHLPHPRGLYSIAFNRAGDTVLTACADNTARLWTVPEGTAMGTLAGHTDRVFHAAFSPDGSTILTTSADHTARLWNARTLALLHTLQGHTDEVRHGSFSPDGKMVVTASRDDTARLWDVQTGTEIAALAGHTADVTHAQFSPDGRTIVTTGDRTARLWSVHRRGRVLELPHPGSVGLASFSPDGKRLLTSSSGWVELSGGTAGLWNAETGASIAPLPHGREVTSSTFDPRGERILTTARDGTARIWDARTGKALVELLRQKNEMNFGAFSPDGGLVAAAATDVYAGGSLLLFDAATGEVLSRVRVTSMISTVEFASDGSRLVTYGNGGTRVWTLVSRKLMPAPLAVPKFVVFALSPDGKWMVGDEGPQFSLRDLESGKSLGALSHRTIVSTAAFSPDRKLLATGCKDGSIHLWDVSTRKEVRLLEGHTDVVNHLHFSEDGKLLVSGVGEMEYVNNQLDFKIGNSKDNSARVWDVQSGKAIAVLRGHTTRVRFATFSRDRTRVVTTSDDRTARVWNLHPSTQALIDEARPLAGPLTPEQRKKFFLD